MIIVQVNLFNAVTPVGKVYPNFTIVGPGPLSVSTDLIMSGDGSGELEPCEQIGVGLRTVAELNISEP